MVYVENNHPKNNEITRKKLNEREKYLMKKLGWSAEYIHKVNIFLLEQKPYNNLVGYCGRGNSSCKKESISSKLVPDFKSKNWSCWGHDLLYVAIDDNLITKELADQWFRYSMYYDAGYNPLKRMSAYLYYRSVCLVGVK